MLLMVMVRRGWKIRDNEHILVQYSEESQSTSVRKLWRERLCDFQPRLSLKTRRSWELEFLVIGNGTPRNKQVHWRTNGNIGMHSEYGLYMTHSNSKWTIALCILLHFVLYTQLCATELCNWIPCQGYNIVDNTHGISVSLSRCFAKFYRIELTQPCKRDNTIGVFCFCFLLFCFALF